MGSFYNAATSAQLQTAFQNIADSLPAVLVKQSASRKSVASREPKSITSNPCFNATRPCDSH